MKNNNHSGFSVVEVIIVLVVICLLALTGWFVQHARQTQNKTQSSSSSTSPSQTLTTYTNTQFGFGFTYPRSWGSVKLTPEAVPSGTTGSVNDITWSASPIKLEGTFNSRNYKVPTDYQGSSTAPFAYGCPPQSFASGQSSVPVVTLYNTASTCVAVTASETAPGTYAVLGIDKAFNSNAKITGISFTNGGDVTGGAVTLKNVSEESVRNAFGASQTQQLLSFAKSIHTIQ